MPSYQAAAGGVSYVALSTHSRLAAHAAPPVDSPSRPDMVLVAFRYA